MLKMTSPPCRATTRRAENERPSRSRSTRKTAGRAASPLLLGLLLSLSVSLPTEHAFAQATVPRVTVVLRKAFGGAYITMNSKDLGADYVFAWPQAEIGVMAAASAVGLIHRRELAAAPAPSVTSL